MQIAVCCPASKNLKASLNYKATHEREEGGTPDIIGSIRLGLVFQLKNEISDELIINTEASYARYLKLFTLPPS